MHIFGSRWACSKLGLAWQKGQEGKTSGQEAVNEGRSQGRTHSLPGPIPRDLPLSTRACLLTARHLWSSHNLITFQKLRLWAHESLGSHSSKHTVHKWLNHLQNQGDLYAETSQLQKIWGWEGRKEYGKGSDNKEVTYAVQASVYLPVKWYLQFINWLQRWDGEMQLQFCVVT